MAILLAQLLQSSLLDKKKFLNERAFFTRTITKLVEYILTPETATIFSIENKTIKHTLLALELPLIQNIIPSTIKNFFLDLFPINNHYLPLKNILGLVTFLLFRAYPSYDKWKKNQQLRAIVLEKKNKENDTLIKNINECSTTLEKFLISPNSILYSKKIGPICRANITKFTETFNEKKKELENALQYENVTCLKEYLSLLEQKYFDIIEAHILTFDNGHILSPDHGPIKKLLREVLLQASFFPSKNVAEEFSKKDELLQKIFVIYSKNFDINKGLINYFIKYMELLNTTFLNIFFANANQVFDDNQTAMIKDNLNLFTERTEYEFFLYQRMREEIKNALESQVGFFNSPYRNINSFMFMIGRSIRKKKEKNYFRNILQTLFPPAIIISLLFTGPRKFIVHKMIIGK